MNYEIFNKLIENDAFFVTEQMKGDYKFHIFNYRLASYTTFQLPGGMEARGIMFFQDKNGDWVLCSRPMAKFFNVNENPDTIGLSSEDIAFAMLKEDGSLISTYWYGDFDNFRVGLKSKGSLYSEQAIAAENWVTNNRRFQRMLHNIDPRYFTVNMEWCAPDNRIVIGYEKPQLVVLNIRNNITGEYVNQNSVESMFGDYVVKRIDVSTFDEVRGWVGKEGIVARMTSGQFVKMKSDWYLRRHQSKEMVNSPKRLVEIIVTENVDDFKQLFLEDKYTLEYIERIEDLIYSKYDHIIATAMHYYNENKGLIRSEYAIKAKDLIDQQTFPVAMSLYSDKPDVGKSLKKWFVSNARDLISGLVYNAVEET